MVFVCPTRQEAEAITKMSSKVQEALQNLDNKLKVPIKPCCIPCCVPLTEYPDHQEKMEPPKIMVCYKEPATKRHKSNELKKQQESVHRLRESKSRELRASILYTGCLCEKRDGLQDDCPRTGCHGSPECLTSPPTCGPSEYCGSKHLGKKLARRKSKKGQHGGQEDPEEHQQQDRYKCFAAMLEPPIVIPCPPCLPCL